MTKVDFYILPQQDSGARFDFACRLTEKAWRLGHAVYLHTDDAEAASALDDWLWQFKPEAFVPHGPLGSADGAQVAVGHGEDPGEHHDVLINLSREVPNFFSRFQRVSEVVVQEPVVVEATRAHYAFYRDRGYPLESHDMRTRRGAR